MPTYSYRCTECGNAFDIVQSFTDDTPDRVPGLLRRAAQGLQPGRRDLQRVGLLPHRLAQLRRQEVGLELVELVREVLRQLRLVGEVLEPCAEHRRHRRRVVVGLVGDVLERVGELLRGLGQRLLTALRRRPRRPASRTTPSRGWVVAESPSRPPRPEGAPVKGFKEFILRGNVIDLAVAVVIGAAFTAIVTSLVTNIFNPLIGAAFNASMLDEALIVAIPTVSRRRGRAEVRGRDRCPHQLPR